MDDKQNLMAKVEQALDSMRPFLKADGGDIELVDIDENMQVSVKLLGNCSNCHMSDMTMKAGVEEAVIRAVPEIEGIVAVAEETEKK